jgi:hypothetical protein
MSEFLVLVLKSAAIVTWNCVLPTLGLLWLVGWLS